MATRSLGALTLDLIVKVGGFVQGMDAAARISEKRLKQIEATAKKIGTGIGLALGAAATGLVAFVKSSAESIASYQDIAEKVGDTAEAVASLKTAADVSETSLDQVAAASIKLTAALSKTDDEGKGVGNALKAIGLEIETFKKLSPVEQIDAVAKALAQFEDGANKTAVAVALFGKSGAELLPFLNDLADGAERQKTLTQEQIDAANELVETYNKLKGQTSTLAQQLAGELIPVALDVVRAFSDLVKEVKLIGGDNSIREFAQSAAIGFATTIEFVVRTIRTINVMRLSILSAIADIRVLNKAASLLNPVGALTGKIPGNDLKSILASREEAIKASDAAIKGLLETNTTAFSDSLRKSFAEAEDFAKKAQGLPKPDLKFSGVPPEAAKKTKEAADAMKDYAFEVAKAVEDEDLERRTAAQDAMNKKIDEARQVFEATRTPLERFNAELAHLNELRATLDANGKPLIDDVTYRRRVVAMQDDLHGLSETTKEVTDEMTVFWDEASRNMQDIFADFLVDPFKDGLKGMLRSFEQMLKQMISQAAAAQIFKAFSAGFTGSGGFLDMILGSGNTFGSSNFGGKLAAGGPVQPGKTYLVGEEGPELFRPTGSGTIIPNGAGGVVQHFNVSIAAPAGTVDRRTMQNTAAEVARAARNASIRNG